MKNKIKVHRQGDIVFVPSNLPVEGKEKKDKIIAEGEATGHAHRVVGDSKLIVLGEEMSIIVDKPEVIRHEEHEDIIINENHDIGNQEEWDWFEKVSRKVLD